jgi:hypothetical protein
VILSPPTAADVADFLAAIHASRTFHRPWLFPPSTPVAYRDRERWAIRADGPARGR